MVVVGIVLMGWITSNVIQEVEQDVESIGTDNFPSVGILGDLEINLHKKRSAILEILQSRSKDEINSLKQELAEIKESSAALLQKYKEKSTVEDGDSITVEMLQKSQDALDPMVVALFQLKVAGMPEKFDASWRALDKAMDDLEALLSSAREKESEDVSEALAHAREIAEAAKVRTAIYISAMVIFGLLIGWFAYFRIAMPLQRLSTTLQEFERRPDLSIRFEKESLSELDAISRSLNLLMEWINQHAAKLENQRDEISRLANHDQLTGLPLWRLGKDRLEHSIAQAERDKGEVATLFIDLDGFKAVNDTFGHDAGDALLTAVGKRMQKQVREGDTVARIGGDEFAAVLGHAMNHQAAAEVAGRIIEAVRDPFEFQGHSIQVGASIGIAFYPQDATEADALLALADKAMYEVKRTGKNSFSFSSESDKAS